MIRKAIIMALTLAAKFLAILWIASYLWWPTAWSKRPSPNIEITHVGRTWWANLAPDSPVDLVHNIQLKNGKLLYYRRVVIDNTLSQPAEFATRHELIGYVLGYGIKPRSLGPRPRPLTSMLIIHPPILPILLVVATYPTIAFIRGPLRRWRRRRRGLCTECAYDLTGNTTGVCSECGEAVGRA